MSGLAILYTLLTGTLYGCAAEKEGTGTNVRLELYANGIREDMRYSITVAGDSIHAVNYYPSLVEGKSSSDRVLSSDEMSSISEHVISITTTSVDTTSTVSDSWSARLIVNGGVAYEQSDFSFDDTSSEAVKLIHYLVELARIPVPLYSFS